MSALYSARDELSALGQQCEISNESLQSRDFFFFRMINGSRGTPMS